MEINLLQSERLTRVFCIKVPQNVLNERFDQYMEELRPQLNLRGFRPGKVPISYAKRLYGAAVMKDVVNEYKNNANEQALVNNKFKPATQFDIQDLCDIEAVHAGKEGLHYHAACEILPVFKPAEIAGLDFQKTVFSYDDKFLESYSEFCIADMLGELVEREEDESVQTGDSVEFEFSISADGNPIEKLQNQSQKAPAGEMPGLFDIPKNLVGMKREETKTVHKKYPKNFIFSEMADKDAELTITIKKIEYLKVKPYDEEDAKEFYGEDDLATFKKNISDNLESFLENAQEEELKIAILDRLEIMHDFQLPEGMVVHEHNSILSQLQEEMKAGNVADDDYMKTTEELANEYRKIAERRVRLGLVLAEIGRIDKIEVSDIEVYEYHVRQRRMTQQQIDEMVKVATESHAAMSQLRAPIYEERVVDHIKAHAIVEENKVDIATVFGDKNHQFHKMMQDYIPKSYLTKNELIKQTI